MQKIPQINPENETEKITTFIRQTFKKTNKTIAIIALSGGIDSATSPALTIKSLGTNQVHALLLPSAQTDPVHTSDAKNLANHLNLPNQNIHTLDLSSVQSSFNNLLNIKPDDSLSSARLGNLTARLRMIVTFDFAKKLNALVVGTENKSEHFLAYYTRFGDEASDLEPIKHLYKTQVRQLAKHLNVIQPIIDKPPTAGLWAGQTDESELGFSYDQADPILYLHFDQNQTWEQIIKQGFDSNLVEKIKKHTDAVAFKHQVPYRI